MSFLQSWPPAGAFKSVRAGALHSCGRRMDDTVACWGNNMSGQSRPPAGAFKLLSAGGAHTCACSGNNENGQLNAPPGTFKWLSAGNRHTRGLQSDDTVSCWGDDTYGQLG